MPKPTNDNLPYPKKLRFFLHGWGLTAHKTPIELWAALSSKQHERLLELELDRSLIIDDMDKIIKSIII